MLQVLIFILFVLFSAGHKFERLKFNETLKLNKETYILVLWRKYNK